MKKMIVRVFGVNTYGAYGMSMMAADGRIWMLHHAKIWETAITPLPTPMI